MITCHRNLKISHSFAVGNMKSEWEEKPKFKMYP
jgi:hypothetical protein